MTPDNLQACSTEAAAAILAGNRLIARLNVENAIGANHNCVDTWLLYAWTSDSPSAAELAINRALEIDPDHVLALAGQSWIQGVASLATDRAGHEGTGSSETVAETEAGLNELMDSIFQEEEVVDKVDEYPLEASDTNEFEDAVEATVESDLEEEIFAEDESLEVEAAAELVADADGDLSNEAEASEELEAEATDREESIEADVQPVAEQQDREEGVVAEDYFAQGLVAEDSADEIVAGDEADDFIIDNVNEAEGVEGVAAESDADEAVVVDESDVIEAEAKIASETVAEWEQILAAEAIAETTLEADTVEENETEAVAESTEARAEQASFEHEPVEEVQAETEVVAETRKQRATPETVVAEHVVSLQESALAEWVGDIQADLIDSSEPETSTRLNEDGSSYELLQPMSEPAADREEAITPEDVEAAFEANAEAVAKPEVTETMPFDDVRSALRQTIDSLATETAERVEASETPPAAILARTPAETIEVTQLFDAYAPVAPVIPEPVAPQRSTATELVEAQIVEQVTEISETVNEAIHPAEIPAAEIVAETPAIEEPAGEVLPVVMIVDDSPTIRKLVAMTLSRNGFEVIAANDGVDALKVLSEQRPDIILSDINMPRLGGYQLCKFVKKHARTKLIPVLMLSGKDGVFDKMRGKMAGANGYITKPFESADLVHQVRQQLLSASVG